MAQPTNGAPKYSQLWVPIQVHGTQEALPIACDSHELHYLVRRIVLTEACSNTIRCGNDPSAGSPTETLLRLHLPLNDEI